MVTESERDEHGRKLAVAMARARVDRTTVADWVGKSTRTITGWTSGAHMPSEAERIILRRMLGDYDSPGDPVEVAIRGSELVEWRQDTVLGFYKRNLTEQREADTA